MNFLEKLQNLSLEKRKIILWLIVGLVALGLFTWWAKSMPGRLESFEKEQLLEEVAPPSFSEESESSQQSEESFQEKQPKIFTWEEIKNTLKELEEEVKKLEE